MRRKVDMVNGPLPINLIHFIVPVILTGVLQLLFNTCDLIVVGQFAGSTALAAVGTTGSLINLLVNAFLGLSTGVNVLAAQAYGARDNEKISDIIHTSVCLSVVFGIILAVIGIVICRPSLIAMNTPAEVLDLAVIYMQIYFLGIPAMMLYNFGAAILRARGNTKQPLWFLTASGIINVILNLIFVLGFHMSVMGVALATTASQFVSAILIVLYLADPSDPYGLEFRKIRIEKSLLGQIFRIGIPASINGMVFSISNIQIQASINLFGAAAMAGSSASSNIEGFIYTSMNAVHHGALNFAGQNYGAGQKEKIPKILWLCILYVAVIGLVLGSVMLLFKEPLLKLYVSDVPSIQYGVLRANIICSTYFICGMMDIFPGVLRGMGYSVMPMIVSLVGACGFRLIWIATVFQWFFSLETLFISYPISWALTMLVHAICYLVVMKREKKKDLLVRNGACS
ncbi:MAG: MATE family efflux transporter [Clostridia bacterium]|nr:MATE family efflux transporter [Clostridia bacterium]